MTPLERAARALAAYDADQGLALATAGETDEQWIDRAWPSFVPRVRAVLAAIREPSEGMLDRAQAAIDQCLEQGEPTILADAGWQAMIDAMLEEGA